MLVINERIKIVLKGQKNEKQKGKNNNSDDGSGMCMWPIGLHPNRNRGQSGAERPAGIDNEDAQ